MCIWEIHSGVRRGLDLGFAHLDSYQGPAGFEALFLYHVWMFCSYPPSCVYFCPLVCWLETLMVLFIVPLESSLDSLNLYFIFPAFLTEVRSEEQKMLERAGVLQSLTVGVAPIVVVMSSVCTFTLHMALGYDLTAAEVCKYWNHAYCRFPFWIHLPSLETCSLCVCQVSFYRYKHLNLPGMKISLSVCTSSSQAFTVVAVFNSMTFALKVTPLAVRSLSEGAVAVKRFQVRTYDLSATITQPHCHRPKQA